MFAFASVQASHPWTDVHQRLKGIIAHMEQQQQTQTMSSVYGGSSQGQQDWRVGRTGYNLIENLSSSSSYMTRAQARAKQLAELRAQQQRQRVREGRGGEGRGGEGRVRRGVCREGSVRVGRGGGEGWGEVGRGGEGWGEVGRVG